MQTRKSAGVVIVDKKAGKVLLVTKAKDPARWDIPKGSIENDLPVTPQHERTE